jgi:prepilin-type N-terminal cleavage/methylation domain-containing protein
MKFGRRGFTLLEVLIALVTFTVVMIALIQAFTIGVSGAGDVENMRTASSIAQARMEAIRNSAFASVVSAAAAADANFPNFTVSVAVTGTDPKTVTVTVTWMYRGSPVSISLTTLRARYSDT